MSLGEGEVLGPFLMFPAYTLAMYCFLRREECTVLEQALFLYAEYRRLLTKKHSVVFSFPIKLMEPPAMA